MAARDEITAFFAGTYTRTNWVTANGYGAFDLSYEPNTQNCVITVKLEFDFQDAPASVLMKYAGASDLTSLSECFWTDDAKKKFQDDMVSEVDRVWSDQHELKCTYSNPDLTDSQSPTWKDAKADVTAVVQPVTSGGHFKVSVLALPKADKLRSHVSNEDHDTTQGIDTDADGVMDRDKVGSTTKAGEVASSDFKTTTARFNSGDNQVNEIGSSFNGKTYTVVAGDTLWSIAEKLFGDGCRWQEIYDANKALVGPDPDLILPGQALTLKVPKTDSGSKTSAVPVEEQRIMDGGEVVETEHYSTIVEALNDATAPVTFAA